MKINLANFTAQELCQLAEIRERVQAGKPYYRIQELEQENIKLRRMLLEAVTSILHHRRLNDEFMQEINQVLRLVKFK